mmetsp:Transcript_20820/g.67037  ORF Transcript_20820/g.67037 Transcript_20820/m.67037 type:complete len:180 (-) Transcript_20820:128-667(-)
MTQPPEGATLPSGHRARGRAPRDDPRAAPSKWNPNSTSSTPSEHESSPTNNSKERLDREATFHRKDGGKHEKTHAHSPSLEKKKPRNETRANKKHTKKIPLLLSHQSLSSHSTPVVDRPIDRAIRRHFRSSERAAASSPARTTPAPHSLILTHAVSHYVLLLSLTPMTTSRLPEGSIDK